MWSKIWNALRSMIAKMTGAKDIQQVLNLMPIVSDKMEEAIELWGDMYQGKANWLHEPTSGDPVKVVSLGLASFIASEKARTATIEMKSLITNPTTMEAGKDVNVTEDFEPKDRAEYLNKQYQLHLIPHIRQQLEYGIAKGGLVIKPYVYNETEIRFSFCQADEFYPISFDPTGKMTEAAFTERIVSGNVCYTRLEYHKLDVRKKSVTVMNKAYKTFTKDTSSSGRELGTEIPLTDVVGWEDIQPLTTINNVDRLLFAYFKMPEANVIDPKSPLGVSGYSRAVDLIREADLQFSRLLWEYEGGEMAVDVDPDALRIHEQKVDGKATRVEIPNVHQARLFRKIDLGTEETYSVFAPTLRDGNYTNGMNSILQRIEDVTGISRGTLSDITRSEAKTATEMLILRQRSYATNNDIQKALQYALEDTVYVMNVYSSLYHLAPEGEYVTSYEWDDSLINSPEEELQRRLTLKNAGIESSLSIRMWYFGETEEQAMQALAIVQQETLQNAQMQALASGMFQNNSEEGKEDEKGNPNDKGSPNDKKKKSEKEFPPKNEKEDKFGKNPKNKDKKIG